MITCKTINGETVELPKEKFVFRPTVYGVVMDGDNILIMNVEGGRIIMPGGGVEIGETIEQALKREIKEEAGIDVEVGQFRCVKECYLYNENIDEAYQRICFYHDCKPLSTDLTNDPNEIVTPEWVNLLEQKKDTSKMGSVTTQIFSEL